MLLLSAIREMCIRDRAKTSTTFVIGDGGNVKIEAAGYYRVGADTKKMLLLWIRQVGRLLVMLLLVDGIKAL